MAAVMPTNWMMKGHGQVIISCNCDYGCPCNVNGRPTTGKCEGGWTWHIDSGRYGATALDDLNFSIFADWPGAIHEGGGRAVAFIDERADEAQQRSIATLMRGGRPVGDLHHNLRPRRSSFRSLRSRGRR